MFFYFPCKNATLATAADYQAVAGGIMVASVARSLTI
jgi:hypothetical protein